MNFVFSLLLALAITPGLSRGQQCSRDDACTTLCGNGTISCARATSQGWSIFNASAGSIAYHIFQVANVNFWQAKLSCTQNNAIPAIILTSAEQSFISNLAAPILQSASTLSQALWIGLHRTNPNRNTAEQACQWDDGSACSYGDVASPASGQNAQVGYPWGTGQPSGINRYTGCTAVDNNNGLCLENCAHMFDSAGHWNDVACGAQSGGIICQKPCSSAPTCS